MTDLDIAKEAAQITLVQWLDDKAAEITGRVPEAERLSWTTKEAAARSVLEGAATAGQQAMIGVEAAVLKRSPTEVAGRIVAKADAWAQIAATLSAVRQMGERDIKAATTPEGTIIALTAAQEALAKALA